MHPSGPANARLMIVGEAPGEYEVMRGQPFVGPSGMELDRMLNEAGLLRSQCFVTNVCQERPPGNDMGQWLVNLRYPPKSDNAKYKNKEWVSWRERWANPAVPKGMEQLEKHILLVRPAVVLALGNTALFALTGEWGIKSWRGSQLVGKVGDHTFKVIPAYHPSAVLRDWSVRGITVHDFRRAARELSTPLPYVVPSYDRIIKPNFVQVVKWFGELDRRLAAGPVLNSSDIETRGGHIACIGQYIKGMPTLCIPFMSTTSMNGSYWNESEEWWIFNALRKAYKHPNMKVIGQNWPYDSQYFYRFLFLVVEAHWDTMTAQHCIFPGMPKGLDYLSSLYCSFHRYWKDDIKDWDPKMGELQFWAYNCEDCERTYEVYEGQAEIISADPRLSGVWKFQTHTLQPLLGKAMRRGIRANVRDKARLSSELDTEIRVREGWLQEVVGHPINWGSPKQLQQLFYVDLKQKEIKNRATKALTTNDEALSTISKREPLLRPLCRKIQELRSIGVFKSTFVEARLDRDQRIRCSFNIGGTVTFRLSSSENAFGSGLNLQNVPQGNDDPDPGELELPNIRKLFIPDEGMTMFDMDLRNADFYTVVWECDDEIFREALERGVDMHLLNAGTVFGIRELIDMDKYSDPEWVAWGKKKYGKQRGFSKAWVHGTDFGGKDRTMAATVGITVAENERLRKRWFGEHPKIQDWHNRTEAQLNTHRFVENKFGYRIYFFDRVDGILPEALAWVPQSTTGCVINRIWAQIDEQIPEAEVLIQVHDSLVGQFPTQHTSDILTKLQDCARVVVPYDRPLVIPVGMKTSTASWGHCG